MTNVELLNFVNKKVIIKMKNGKCFKGVLEKWIEYHGNLRYYTFNIRNVIHNIFYYDVKSIKEY